MEKLSNLLHDFRIDPELLEDPRTKEAPPEQAGPKALVSRGANDTFRVRMTEFDQGLLARIKGIRNQKGQQAAKPNKINGEWYWEFPALPRYRAELEKLPGFEAEGTLEKSARIEATSDWIRQIVCNLIA